MQKQLFITGGSGYIGRNLIRTILGKGWSVRALARSTRSADLITSLGAEPVKGDLLDADALSRGMSGCHALIHAAADTDHSGKTEAQKRTNLDGTELVYEIAEAGGIQRAVHISTEAVLLDGNPLRDATESMAYPSKPAGEYSRTKGEAERIALRAAAAGLDLSVVRPRFVWGRDDTSALPQIIDAAQSGKLAWIDGGDYLTSTTHIDNLTHGVWLALERGEQGEVYFIADEKPVPFRWFITQLLVTQGVAAPARKVPRWLVKNIARFGDALGQMTGDRVKGPMSFQEYATLGVEVTLSIDKARDRLGYQPVISIDQGLSLLRD